MLCSTEYTYNIVNKQNKASLLLPTTNPKQNVNEVAQA